MVKQNMSLDFFTSQIFFKIFLLNLLKKYIASKYKINSINNHHKYILKVCCFINPHPPRTRRPASCLRWSNAYGPGIGARPISLYIFSFSFNNFSRGGEERRGEEGKMTALWSALAMLNRRSSRSWAAAYMGGTRQEVNNKAFHHGRASATAAAAALQPSAIRNSSKEVRRSREPPVSAVWKLCLPYK